jgi:hypothetical protein
MSEQSHSYNFGQVFLNELVDFGSSSAGSLPVSTVFVIVVFLLDTTLRSSTAKLYFVAGYFVELLIFYSFARILYPAPDQKSETMNVLLYLATPLQRYTHASFFNFSAGYILGYWGNLNILLNAPNATLNVSYYTVFVLFCFMYSVFYLGSVDENNQHKGLCSWQSGLISASMGVLGGIVCSHLISDRVKLETQYDGQFIMNSQAVSRQDNSNIQLSDGVTQCGSGKNDDMICKVFRAGIDK